MQENKLYHQSSDIFHTKSVGKPEYNQPPKRIRHNNNSEADLLSWKKEPKIAEKDQKPIRVHRSPPKMSMQPEQRLTIAKSTTGKRTKSSVVLGTYDNSEFKVKRGKDKAYDPSKYFTIKSAYDLKFQHLSQSEMDDSKPASRNLNNAFKSEGKKRQFKTTMGTMREEFKEEKPNFKMVENYVNHDLPGTERESQRGKFRKEMMHTNSTGINFNNKKQTQSIRVDQLKSNIFNDPDKEKLNQKDSNYISEERKNAEALRNAKKDVRPKTNRIAKEGENYICKLDWKDPKTSLFFKSKEEPDIRPIDRKMNELYGGSIVNEAWAAPQTERDLNVRNNIKNKMSVQNPKENFAKIQKKMENVAYYQNQNPEYYIPSNTQPKASTDKKYELKNFTDSKNVNLEDVEKAFRSKGLHIYGIKNETGLGGYETKGRITFKIRNNESNNIIFNRKLNDAKQELKKKSGYEISNYTKEKKEK